MVKTAMFRFEAALNIGAGHAIRSCVLADVLARREWRVVLVASAATFNFVPHLKKYERIDPEVFLLNPFKHDLLVIDHYGIDSEYEAKFRLFAEKILIIDDLANRRHDCDFLLDQTYGRDPTEYRAWVPSHCVVLAGVDYALLRDEFTLARPAALAKRRKTREIRNLLIALGSNPPMDAVCDALSLVKKNGFNGEINIALGFDPQDAEILTEYVRSFPNKITFAPASDMARLMIEADMAIGAAGSSTWERMCLGLPTILVKAADNQSLIYKHMIDAGFCYGPQDFAKVLQVSLGFEKNTAIVDGFGKNRVAQAIEGETRVKVTKVTAEHLELIFKWQHEKGLRRYFNNPELPSYEEHCRWFGDRLKRPENPFWLIMDGTTPCGTISLVYDLEDKCFELGWYVIPTHQGKGIGTEALRLITALVRPFPIKAYVKAENLPSQRALANSGFKNIGGNNYLFA